MKYAIYHENYENLELIEIDMLEDEDFQKFYLDDNNIEWYNSHNANGSYLDLQVFGACEHDALEILYLILENFDFEKFETMHKMNDSCSCFEDLSLLTK